MTYEANQVVELGQAEELIATGVLVGDEEMWDKFERGAAPYVEFE